MVCFSAECIFFDWELLCIKPKDMDGYNLWQSEEEVESLIIRWLPFCWCKFFLFSTGSFWASGFILPTGGTPLISFGICSSLTYTGKVGVEKITVRRIHECRKGTRCQIQRSALVLLLSQPILCYHLSYLPERDRQEGAQTQNANWQMGLKRPPLADSHVCLFTSCHDTFPCVTVP